VFSRRKSHVSKVTGPSPLASRIAAALPAAAHAADSVGTAPADPAAGADAGHSTVQVDRTAVDADAGRAATMRDAMRAALDAKAGRRGQAPATGPRAGSDGPTGRGGGAKGFRALPRRSAG